MYRNERNTRFECLLQLAGLSLFLATIELLIPKPMPFLKLGIANLPILLFVRQLKFRELILLSFLKVFCQSLLSGTLLSYIVVFSACSSLASGSAMWLLSRLSQKNFSLLGISTLGAASSNGIQLLLALAYFFPGTGNLLIPWSLSFGLASGIFLGLAALHFAGCSNWFATTLTIMQQPKDSADQTKKLSTKKKVYQSSGTTALLARRQFILGLASLGLMFAINRYEPIYLLLELLLFLWLNKKLGYRIWWHSMLLLLVVLVFFHLLLPSGTVLWQMNIPPYIQFKLTLGALRRGTGKALFLLNLIQISRFAISPQLQLPGALGHIVQRVFYHYRGLLNSPLKFSLAHPFASLDAILCHLENHTMATGPEYSENKLSPLPPSPKISSAGASLPLIMVLALQIALVAMSLYIPLYRLFSF